MASVLLLAGCATTAIDDNFKAAEELAAARIHQSPVWLTRDDLRRDANANVERLLRQPLGADDAVRIALAHSPSLQAVLYDSAAQSAAATQSARLPNPVFSFEHLLRQEPGVRELEITRTLAVSLFDIIMLPTRMRLAEQRQQTIRLKLASDVLGAATVARQAWVRAVAAQQAVQYAQQVKATADAGAELARRMQAAGNFSKLQRAREQAFAAEAVAQLARAQQSVLAAREALVRTLGLNSDQARVLQLPDRLPELPHDVRDERSVQQIALDERLDIRIAKATLGRTASELGLTKVTSVVNGLTIGAINKSETGLAPKRGYDLELTLPLFDFGDAARAQAEATYMAAFNRTSELAVDASSEVRETYYRYRTAYDLARHYRDEIVPLRKAIADENLLRYNGMLIGVFDLLADAREQVSSVTQAIETLRDFWLADAALDAALAGSPRGAVGTDAAAAPTAAARQSD